MDVQTILDRILDRIDGPSDVKPVLNDFDHVPPFDKWTAGKLTAEFGANELQSLARWMRDNTGDWVSQMRKSETAEFIRNGIVANRVVEKYDVNTSVNFQFSDDFLLRTDSTLGSDDSSESSDESSDESNKSNARDRSELGPIETTVLETVEEQFKLPDQDVEGIIDEKMDEIVSRVSQRVDATPDPISVELVNGETVDVGMQHGHFPAVLRLARMDDVIPYLVGMPGAGKSHMAEAIADAMGLDFASSSCSAEMSKFSDFLGIFNPQDGSFLETDFVKMAREGGLFLLDEVDRAPAGVTIFLNTLMANGTISLHGESLDVHPDFTLLAAGNTHMRGRSKQYRAGAQDVAFIDRLAFLEMPTDEALEATLAGVNPEDVGADRPEIDLSDPEELATTTKADWVDYVQSIRKAMNDLDQEYIASMRATQSGLKMLANGFPRECTEEALIWRGASKDVRQRVKQQATDYASR